MPSGGCGAASEKSNAVPSHTDEAQKAAREIDKRRKKDAKEGAREPDASEEEDGPGRRWRRFLRHVAVYAVVNTFVTDREPLEKFVHWVE